ncbi:hypothetical protein BU16DRAFT_565220 [Lophium mytilinum]|uniref:Uncharacterized protein n=1 Tax=Lophium mytilinum TaxID=390894 RepID=A0A6A6QHG2_9PEZI|nr:hypothetical protein BU16DRAFT_565220 [Lophium mytilinum]
MDSVEDAWRPLQNAQARPFETNTALNTIPNAEAVNFGHRRAIYLTGCSSSYNDHPLSKLMGQATSGPYPTAHSLSTSDNVGFTHTSGESHSNPTLYELAKSGPHTGEAYTGVSNASRKDDLHMAPSLRGAKYQFQLWRAANPGTSAGLDIITSLVVLTRAKDKTIHRWFYDLGEFCGSQTTSFATAQLAPEVPQNVIDQFQCWVKYNRFELSFPGPDQINAFENLTRYSYISILRWFAVNAPAGSVNVHSGDITVGNGSTAPSNPVPALGLSGFDLAV